MAELDDKDADLLVGVPVVDTDSQSILSIRM
jgi:hypothetical protein